MPEKRTWVYVQEPEAYEIAGCPCGNAAMWSEFKGMLWCPVCQKDFVPEHNGIFDGPIPIEAMRLIGIDLRIADLESGVVYEVGSEEWKNPGGAQ